MSSTESLQPIPAAERIEAMDVLRGVALFGILLMNIEAFVGPLLAAVTGLDPALHGADRLVDAAIYVLVQGKFYLLFSLLFGMGFAVMSHRAEVAGRPFFMLYLRRILALLLIGLIHALLIWSGDILTTYALIAFPMLVIFRGVPSRQLPYWAIGCYLFAVAMMVGFGVLGWLASLEPTIAAEMSKALQQQGDEMRQLLDAQRVAYGSGGYWDAVAQRATDAVFNLALLMFIGGQILGMFLLGAWFVRSGAIERPQDFQRLFAGLRWIGVPVGLGMMSCSFAMVPTQAYDRLDLVSGVSGGLAMCGGLLMCLGYLAWILRGLSSPLAPALRLTAPAGRMALSNYLGQSVICTLIFYGYGLGYFERLPRAWQPAFALALFALQVLVSRWWLARFRYGPAEWLWRAATYLQWPAMRRA
ncbi:MAG: DUF418 domain-containing protein [Lysobacteraceae bacterium]|nr:MAG: DUF418 domain-containing protein [Xanthomonadaceae bacterium]